MFQVGDKVCIPKTKSTGVPLRVSKLIQRATQSNLAYLHITDMHESGYILSSKHLLIGIQGCFSGQDLVLYNPEDHYIGGVVDVSGRG